MTISIAENLVKKDYPETVTKLLQLVKTRPMVRKYEFASLQGGFSKRILFETSADCASRSAYIPGSLDGFQGAF